MRRVGMLGLMLASRGCGKDVLGDRRTATSAAANRELVDPSCSRPYDVTRFVASEKKLRHGTRMIVQLATDAHTGAEVALKRANEEPVLLKHHHGYVPRKDHRAHAMQEWLVAVRLAPHLHEPGGEFLSLPIECFGGNGSLVLLYREQLEEFSWTKKRTSAEWWKVAREVLAGLDLMARHGVFQADMTHDQINQRGRRVTSVSNLMATAAGVSKIIGRCTRPCFFCFNVHPHARARARTRAHSSSL